LHRLIGNLESGRQRHVAEWKPPPGMGISVQDALQVFLPGKIYLLLRITPTATNKVMQRVSEYGLFELPGQSRMD
jgi:hypothetical protein